MTIDKQSWFYRAWASTYVDAGRPPPTRVTLCAMFWRTVLVWALRVCMAGALLLIVGTLGLVFWRDPDAFVSFVTFLGVIAGIVGGVVCGCYVLDLLDLLSSGASGPGRDAIRNSVPVAIFRAWKEKVCPLVTFTDTEHEDGAA